METLIDTNTLAIIAVVYAAASEIIGLLPIKDNSNVQLMMTVIKSLFNLSCNKASIFKIV